ncbi:hypothetical protein B0O99DRAFT_689663 [Bisporella sp. PMI_857]|nr:hypothetical protein B0O99DRAFT_689663 [Bisporella sp. PMI_857]
MAGSAAAVGAPPPHPGVLGAHNTPGVASAQMSYPCCPGYYESHPGSDEVEGILDMALFRRDTEGQLSIVEDAMYELVDLTVPKELVTIIVGPNDDPTAFMLHRSIVCDVSTYFNAAFAGDFSEDDTQSMRITDVDAKTFGLVAHFIHHHEIRGVEFIDFPLNYKIDADVNLPVLAKLWVFAQHAILPALRNLAINAMTSLLLHEPFERGVLELQQFVYGADNDFEQLKLLLEAFWSCYASKSQLAEHIDSLPMELLRAVLISSRKDGLGEGASAKLLHV